MSKLLSALMLAAFALVQVPAHAQAAKPAEPAAPAASAAKADDKKEAKPAEIDAKDRGATAGDTAGSTEQGAISAEDDDQVDRVAQAANAIGDCGFGSAGAVENLLTDRQPLLLQVLAVGVGRGGEHRHLRRAAHIG